MSYVTLREEIDQLKILLNQRTQELRHAEMQIDELKAEVARLREENKLLHDELDGNDISVSGVIKRAEAAEKELAWTKDYAKSLECQRDTFLASAKKAEEERDELREELQQANSDRRREHELRVKFAGENGALRARLAAVTEEWKAAQQELIDVQTRLAAAEEVIMLLGE